MRDGGRDALSGHAQIAESSSQQGWRHTMSRFVSWIYRRMPGLHPGMDLLISYSEGRSSGAIEGHLARCERCARNVQLIAAAVQATQGTRQADASDSASLLHETFDRLRLQMRAWCSVGGLQSPERYPAKSLPPPHVAKALEF